MKREISSPGKTRAEKTPQQWRSTEDARMIVGITYDLREQYLAEGFGEQETAEFDRPDTIEAIERTLQDLGYPTDRIGNIRSLAARLVQGDRWDLVFNLAEGLRGYGREAQVPALLDAYGIPCTLSDALVMSLTLHKGMTKHVVRDLGIPTPDFAVVAREQDIATVDLPYPLFAKPVAEGTGKGISPSSKIHDRNELVQACRSLLAGYSQPVLVEAYLPGREFTVGITGTDEDAACLGVVEVILKECAEQNAYSYLNKEECEIRVEYRLVKDPVAARAAEVALAAYRGLGCRDAARVDLRSDAKGLPNFMEVNPLPGLHPEHSDLPILCTLAGIPYRELIGRIMKAATSRIVHANSTRTSIVDRRNPQ
jgi:D-alanine-D-alanine ligase